jgi:hypothetical protein
MQKKKCLFVATGSPSDIVLNWFGKPMEKMDSYAEAYHLAARRLFEKSSNAELRDEYVCPVVFLYRHSLEILLKEILINGQKILQLEAKPFQTEEQILKIGHNLSSLWKELKKLHEQIDWTWETDLDAQGEIIEEFDELDSNSFSFRYPVTKDGDSALGQNFSFDLHHFCDRMDEVLEKLDSVSCGIAGVLDQMDQN